MSRGINNIDLGVTVAYRCILCQDRDATFPFQIIGVHNTVHNFLIFAVHAALLEHFVDEGGLAVVDVGDDGYIAKFFILHR